MRGEENRRATACLLFAPSIREALDSSTLKATATTAVSSGGFVWTSGRTHEALMPHSMMEL